MAHKVWSQGNTSTIHFSLHFTIRMMLEYTK